MMETNRIIEFSRKVVLLHTSFVCTCPPLQALSRYARCVSCVAQGRERHLDLPAIQRKWGT